MTTSALGPSATTTLLSLLIEAPGLVQTLRELPPNTFSALVRHIGVEDAGELIALGTTEQLVAAFDEDLFASSAAGEREEFQSERFVVWLEVLMAGDEQAAASKITELSEDFVVMALSSIVLVLDHDALLSRMAEGGPDARAADKAIESSLSEEIDGYLLLSRVPDGWDAALSLILALDRDHREYLVRILDRCAELSSDYTNDLEGLTSALRAAESVADDVLAEREERRAKQGYVEPRAARSFLALARMPFTGSAAKAERDPITRAYLRDLEPARAGARPQHSRSTARLVRALGAAGVTTTPATLDLAPENDASDPKPLVTAMRLLAEQDPERWGEQMESLAFLTNVLLAGASHEDRRMTPAEAAEAVLATVERGAALEAKERQRAPGPVTPSALSSVLRDCPLDVLFRKASSTS